MREKNIKKELQEIAPMLAQLKGQKEGFEVPNLYFDKLEQNIFARIKAEEEAESWSAATPKATSKSQLTPIQKISNWLMRPQIAISFSLALVAVLAIGIFVFPTNDTNGELAISDEEALEYIENNIDLFSEELIFETMETDLAEMDFSTEFNVNEEELNEYIEEYWIDEIDENLMKEVL